MPHARTIYMILYIILHILYIIHLSLSLSLSLCGCVCVCVCVRNSHAAMTSLEFGQPPALAVAPPPVQLDPADLAMQFDANPRATVLAQLANWQRVLKGKTWKNTIDIEIVEALLKYIPWICVNIVRNIETSPGNQTAVPLSCWFYPGFCQESMRRPRSKDIWYKHKRTQR